MSTDLQILGAAYGLVEVTSKVIPLVNRSSNPQSLSVQANDTVLKVDGWPGVPKTLVVVYRYGESGSVNVKTAKEGTTLIISGAGSNVLRSTVPNQKLTVLAAAYGPKDVTSTVTSLVNQSTQSLVFTPNNNTFSGDPWVDIQKSFVIVAEYVDETPFMDIVAEDQLYSLKYRPPLQIFNAYYGPQSVLPIVRSAVSRRAVSIMATDQIFSDTWSGQEKTLSVVYQYGDQVPQQAVVLEGSLLTIDYNPAIGQYNIPTNPLTLNVVSAAYGPKDVTSIVNSLKNDNQLGFSVGSDIFGPDPLPGHKKTFSMTYSWGPSPPKSLVAIEGDPISITNPDPQGDFISLSGIVATGDQITFQSINNRFWQVVNKQILVTAESLGQAEKFTMTKGSDLGSFYLQAMSDQSYVTTGTDGTLYTGGTSQSATLLTVSLLRDGSTVISVVGNKAIPFMAISSIGAIVAMGSYMVDGTSTFYMSWMNTKEGISNRLKAHGIEDIPEDEDVALAKVIWDLTGGLFLATGLGPYIIQGTIAPGFVSLLRSVPTVWNAILGMRNTLLNNRKASITSVLIIVGLLIKANLFWTACSMVMKVGEWVGVSYIAVKALEFAFRRYGFFEVTVSLTEWFYQTKEDYLAWINSGDKDSLPLSIEQ